MRLPGFGFSDQALSIVVSSAETIAQTVAAPIEEQLSGAEGMVYFTSSAGSDGQLTITATFEVGAFYLDPYTNVIEILAKPSRGRSNVTLERWERGGLLIKLGFLGAQPISRHRDLCAAKSR